MSSPTLTASPRVRIISNRTALNGNVETVIFSRMHINPALRLIIKILPTTAGFTIPVVNRMLRSQLCRSWFVAHTQNGRCSTCDASFQICYIALTCKD